MPPVEILTPYLDEHYQSQNLPKNKKRPNISEGKNPKLNSRLVRTESPIILFIAPALPQIQSSGSLFCNFPTLAIIGSFCKSKAKIASLKFAHFVPKAGLS